MRANQLLTLLAGLVLSHAAFAQAAVKPTPVSPATDNTVKKLVGGVNAAEAGNSSTQQIEKTVHQYLMKKPEIVVEALQAYQQKQMESMQQLFKDTQQMAPKYADALFHQNVDPVGGNSQGKVAIVEFSDYQCSHCIETASIIDTAIKADPSLKVIIKEFPIRGPISEAAAKAALAANKQGKYWEFRDALFKSGANLTQDKIFEVALSVGLNVDQLKKDMNDPVIKNVVEANKSLAKTLKLVGTPAFFVARADVKADAPSTSINYIPGVVSQEQLQSIVTQLNK